MCKHDYKQTGKVLLPTGKFWVKVIPGDYMQKLDITNLDRRSVEEIQKECLVFICNKCENVIVKDISKLKEEYV